MAKGKMENATSACSNDTHSGANSRTHMTGRACWDRKIKDDVMHAMTKQCFIVALIYVNIYIYIFFMAEGFSCCADLGIEHRDTDTECIWMINSTFSVTGVVLYSSPDVRCDRVFESVLMYETHRI